MKKREEEYFYNEYKEICKKFCCDYKIKLSNIKLKYAYLIIAKDNAIESIFCEELKSLFSEYETSIIQIVETIGNEFEKSLDRNFFEKFKKENEKNINSYFDEIQTIIENEIRKEIQESTKTRLNILKENLKSNIITNSIKKNDSVKRILKKERKKNGFLSQIINSIIDNFIGYFIAFSMGIITSNWNEIIETVKGFIS